MGPISIISIISGSQTIEIIEMGPISIISIISIISGPQTIEIIEIIEILVVRGAKPPNPRISIN